MNQHYQSPQSQLHISYDGDVVSIKEWLMTFLILSIPFLNLVMVFVWAFGSNTSPSKANFFKAYLLFIAILMALYVVILTLIYTFL